MAKQSTTAKATKAKQVKKHENKQASAALSIFGIIGLTAVIISSQFTKAEIPGIVYAIFAGIIVPPEVLKRVLKSFVGGGDK